MPTLLVCYIIIGPSFCGLNNFYISSLLFGGYARFILLYQKRIATLNPTLEMNTNTKFAKGLRTNRRKYGQIDGRGPYNYWLYITSFKSCLGKKETNMFYVASIITFSVFLELLWMPTLLVRYSIIGPGLYGLNQFYISSLLFGRYARFILLDKKTHRNAEPHTGNEYKLINIRWC